MSNNDDARFETLAAASVALLAEAVAVSLAFAAFAVWLSIYATSGGP